MLKNVTLTADEALINAAREKARKKHTTLNHEFRRWLNNYARQEYSNQDYQALMAKLAYAYTTKTFSRDEMNER